METIFGLDIDRQVHEKPQKVLLQLPSFQMYQLNSQREQTLQPKDKAGSGSNPSEPGLACVEDYFEYDNLRSKKEYIIKMRCTQARMIVADAAGQL